MAAFDRSFFDVCCSSTADIRAAIVNSRLEDWRLPRAFEGLMSTNRLNHQRVFAGVLSIDAWHEKFLPDTATVKLHADVVFSQARVGGETESQIRFRLSIKRAELSVIVSETEPLGVNKRSVRRSGQVKTEDRTFEQTTELIGATGGDAKIAVGPTKMSGSFSTEALGKLKRILKKKQRTTENVAAIEVIYRYDNFARCDRWTFEPGIGDNLVGRPWSALKSPLLELVDLRNDRAKETVYLFDAA